MSAVDGASAVSAIPAGGWSVDPSRSSVAFAVKHMMLATMNGRFHDFGGTLDIGTGAPHATGTGGVLVGDKVKIALRITAVKGDVIAR